MTGDERVRAANAIPTVLAAKDLLDVLHTDGDDDVSRRAAEPHQVVIPGRRAVLNRAEVRQAADICSRNALRETWHIEAGSAIEHRSSDRQLPRDRSRRR